MNSGFTEYSFEPTLRIIYFLHDFVFFINEHTKSHFPYLKVVETLDIKPQNTDTIDQKSHTNKLCFKNIANIFIDKNISGSVKVQIINK